MTAPVTMMDLATRRDHEDELTRRYPDAMFWYGVFTRKFWALVKNAYGAWVYLAAVNPLDLPALIEAARTVFPDPLDTSKPLVPPGQEFQGRHVRRR